MAQSKKTTVRNQLLFSALVVVLGLAAIATLAFRVTFDLQQLSSANSDNVQWTLSQTEVEFLEFEIQLEAERQNTAPDLTALRRSFDIFYSRVMTLEQASIYAPVRAVPEFASNLTLLRRFLETSVTSIDAADPVLAASLDALAEAAYDVRPAVRGVSNAGLNFFANESDARRNNIAVALTRMAIGVTVLLVTLLFLALYLGHLNKLNIRRHNQAKQANKRMNIVTSTALDAVVVCDVDGKVLDFNEAAVQIFGYSAEEAIGSDLGALIVPDHHRAAHDVGMKRMRAQGEKRVVGKGRIKLDAKRANGELFPVEFAIQSADTHQGEIFISFLRDISHRVAAEKDLVAARDRALAGEKAKTDFLATMSHEIRTPLNGLLGNLTLLSDTDLSADQTRYIKNMDTSGKLLMSHISDVLDITKYDAGKLTLRPVVMNISTLLQDIVDNQGGAASSQDIALTWGWNGPNIDWIRADKERIQHILMNVIGNAVKFTQKGHVAVTAQIIGEVDQDPDFEIPDLEIPDLEITDLEITVQDTGVGISPALKEQIFDDFMTGDVAYDRAVGGTGLGLGIAKRFVNALGGTITVQSQQGQGSTFTIRFPVAPTAPPETAESRPSVQGTGGCSRVLLVEDNEINRVVAREMLVKAGHHVTEAHNGQIAVDLVQQQSFDLILMDISMPIMDGRRATRAIRSLPTAVSATPIIALTANAVAEEQEAFLSDGMNDILTKPLSRDAMLTVLARYAGPAQVQDSHQAAGGVATPPNPHLQELQETLGIETVQSLLERFHTEVDDAVAYLGHRPSAPLADIAQKAHKIAGSAATLGAKDLHAALIAIENAAKAQDDAGVLQLTADLPGLWQAVKPTIRVQS